VFSSGVGEGRRRPVGPIMLKMIKYYIESKGKLISYIL